jgi:copper chaperone NosL
MKWRRNKMKKIVTSMISGVLLVFIFLSTAGADNVKPVPVKKSDKCPVCGMFVAGYKTWVAEVVFRDGTYAAFDGPKDMFKYYLNLPKFDRSKKQSDIAGVFVTEYYSAKLMEAQGLFFVKGSDVFGPMGAELIPVASMEKAQTFMKDHGGKKILRFSEVTMEALK